MIQETANVLRRVLDVVRVDEVLQALLGLHVEQSAAVCELLLVQTIELELIRRLSGSLRARKRGCEAVELLSAVGRHHCFILLSSCLWCSDLLAEVDERLHNCDKTFECKVAHRKLLARSWRVLKWEAGLGDSRHIVDELLKNVCALQVRVVVKEDIYQSLGRFEDALEHLNDEPALKDGAGGVLENKNNDVSKDEPDLVLCTVRRLKGLIRLSFTLRCWLNLLMRVEKREREAWKTRGTGDTPFMRMELQRYFLIAPLMKRRLP